jgi:hypothetical protein
MSLSLVEHAHVLLCPVEQGEYTGGFCSGSAFSLYSVCLLGLQVDRITQKTNIR